MDAAQTLKNSEVDLSKAREDIKEMTRARDSVESGLASAQKQAENQTKRLLETEDQLKITKEQIVDLKKKLVEAEEAKNVAEWARDETLKAKAEAKFARTEAKSSKEKAEEKAYDSGVAETLVILKAQIPGVCRLYYSQVWNEALKQAGVEASFDLWKVEKVYYPLAIRETASVSSEAVSAPDGAETARPEAALVVSTPDEPAKRGELPGVAETHGSLNPEAPQEAVEPIVSAQVSHAEEPSFLVQPFQTILPADVSKGLEANPAQLPKEGAKIKLKK